MQVGGILLAAGASTRMGQPKQLLPWKGNTLLGHALAVAKTSRLSSVVVILGANSELVRTAFSLDHPHVVINKRWETGMGSSLKAGLAYLTSKSNPDAIMAMVCDQPFVTTAHLDRLLEAFERSGKQAVASGYGATSGVPAIFGKHLYEEILRMPDDEGAKKIIARRQENERITIELVQGETDLDTYDDYSRFAQ